MPSTIAVASGRMAWQGGLVLGVDVDRQHLQVADVDEVQAHALGRTDDPGVAVAGSKSVKSGTTGVED